MESPSRPGPRNDDQRGGAGTRWLVGLCLAAAPAFLDPGALARAASLWELAEQPMPYWAGGAAGLLYLWVPIVAVSACVLFMVPGLLLAAAYGRPRSLVTWIVDGLACSLVAISLTAMVADRVFGGAVRGRGFALLVAALAFVCGFMARRRGLIAVARHGRATRTTDRWHLLIMLAVPAVLVAALAPKFHWEAFNSDGAHAFEVARSLLVRPLPFLPAEAGDVSNYPGLTSFLFAYPMSWFIRLFGEIESSGRLPFLLFLPALAAAIVAVAEAGRSALDRTAVSLVWLALGAYTLSMAFSASYNPYSADLTLPATQDTLLMVCFLACVAAFLTDERRPLAAFAVLTFVSLPSGVLLLGFWLVAYAIASRRLLTPASATLSATLAACLVASAVIPRILGAMGAPVPGGEYNAAGLFRYLRVPAILRPLPPGIRRHSWGHSAVPGARHRLAKPSCRESAGVDDGLLLRLLLRPSVCVAPSLRARDDSADRPDVAPGARLPLGAPPLGDGGRGNRHIRRGAGLASQRQRSHVGQTRGARGREPCCRVQRSGTDALASADVLQHLFRGDWDGAVRGNYGGSALVWNHYAHRRPAFGPVNYVVQRHTDPVPNGMTLVQGDGRFALLVRSSEVWQEHRAYRQPSAASRFLHVPGSTMFRVIAVAEGQSSFDAAAFLQRRRDDVNRVLVRLGLRSR